MTSFVGAARQLPFAGLLAALSLVMACTSGDSSGEGGATQSSPPTGRQTATAPAQPFAAVVGASEFVVGPNRFPIGLIDQATGQPVPDASVHFRFFTLQGNQGTLRFEADAYFVAPARDAGVTGVVQHRHPDGSDHPHANIETDVGVYVARVTFNQPGQWGVETTFQTKDGRQGKINSGFQVLAQSKTPAVGAPAPRTKNLTARDVQNLSDISSAIDPNPALYQTTIADAIAAGKPALVAFVTPGFCETRFCGPVYELVNKLVPAYGDRVAMIHIEVWKDPATRIPADAVTEWRLESEPYIFVIDRSGNVSAKFEGSVSLAELEEALAQVAVP